MDQKRYNTRNYHHIRSNNQHVYPSSYQQNLRRSQDSLTLAQIYERQQVLSPIRKQQHPDIIVNSARIQPKINKTMRHSLNVSFEELAQQVTSEREQHAIQVNRKRRQKFGKTTIMDPRNDDLSMSMHLHGPAHNTVDFRDRGGESSKPVLNYHDEDPNKSVVNDIIEKIRRGTVNLAKDENVFEFQNDVKYATSIRKNVIARRTAQPKNLLAVVKDRISRENSMSDSEPSDLPSSTHSHSCCSAINLNTLDPPSTMNPSSRQSPVNLVETQINPKQLYSAHKKKQPPLKDQSNTMQLTNQFNQGGLLTGLKQGIEGKLAVLMKSHLTEGVKTADASPTIGESAQILRMKQDQSSNSQSRPSHLRQIADQYAVESEKQVTDFTEFFDHFVIEEMLNSKCVIARCNKLKGQLFLLKQIQTDTQSLVKDQKISRKDSNPTMNLDLLLDLTGLVDKWVDTVPQIALQSMMPCYGVLRVKDQYYTVCDLVQDYTKLPFQQADFSLEKGGYDMCGQENGSRTTTFSAREGEKDTKPEISKSVYKQIQWMNLGNLSTLPVVPDSYASFLVRYIIYVSRAFSHAHRNDLIHGKFNPSKVIIQQPYQGYSRPTTPADPEDSKNQLVPFNFFVVNFEPWTTYQTIRKFSNDPQFQVLKKCLKDEKIQQQWERYAQIHKILDLWAFGNSIVDIMVGKSQEDIVMSDECCKESNPKQFMKLLNDQVQNQSRPSTNAGSRRDTKIDNEGVQKSQKPWTGGISMDSIPLNWSRKPYLNDILNVFQLSFGTYSPNNNILDLNTHEIFQKIFEVALNIEKTHFKDSYGANYWDPLRNIDFNKVDSYTNYNRLRSTVLNNQASLLGMTVNFNTPLELRNKTLARINNLYNRALKYHKDNIVANINKALTQWQEGSFSDEDFLLYLITDIASQDPLSAKLLFYIFCKRITCYKLEMLDVFQTIQKIDQQIETVSNLTKFLYDLPDIREFRQKCLRSQRSSKQSIVGTGQLFNDKFVYQESQRPTINTTIDLNDVSDSENNSDDQNNQKEMFQPKGFFVSNNDYYVAVVGQTETWVIDSRKGEVVYKQDLPKESKKEARSKKYRYTILGSQNSEQETLIGRRSPIDKQSSLSEDSDSNSSSSAAELLTGSPQNQLEINLPVFKLKEQQKAQKNVQFTHVEELEEDQSISIEQPSISLVDVHEGGERYVKHPIKDSVKMEDQQLTPKDLMMISNNSTLPNSNNMTAGATSRNHGSVHDPLFGDSAISMRMNTVSPSQRSNVQNSNFDDSLNKVLGVQQYTLQTIQSGEYAGSNDFSSRNLYSPVEKIASSSSVNKLVDTIKQDIQIRNEIEQVLVDKEEGIKLYPVDWVCEISNTGKMLAFYDRGQSKRNRYFKFQDNKKEDLHIYSIVIGKKQQTQCQKLNMIHILDNNEVLSFSFDDFNESFSTICVQGRDLCLYFIDHIQHKVIHRINGTHAVMKSVFYQINSQDSNNNQRYQEVKEFVQNQEAMGNQVILPKIHKDFIALRYKKTNLIMIYSIHLKKIVRKFILNIEELQFDKQFLENLIKVCTCNKDELHDLCIPTTLDPKDYQKHVRQMKYKAPGFSHAFDIGTRLENYDHYKRERLSKKQVENQVSKRISTTSIVGEKSSRSVFESSTKDISSFKKEAEENRRIHLLEFGSSGSIFVAYIGSSILIKVLNMQDDTMNNVNLDQSQYYSYAPLLPFYFDYDYTWGINSRYTQTNEKVLVDQAQIQKENHAQLQHINLQRISYLMESMINFNGSTYAKNEKLIEMLGFVKTILNNPAHLFICNAKKKKRVNFIETCLHLIRAFQGFDIQQVRPNSVLRSKELIRFYSIQYPSSLDNVRSFICSNAVNKFSMAVLLKKRLQFYSFITGQLLFQVNIPNTGIYLARQGMQIPFQKIYMVDNDNIIALQDSPYGLRLICVQSEIESFSQQNIKQVEREITYKIDKPLGYDIDVDNGMIQIGKDDPNKATESSDGEDGVIGENKTKPSYIQYDIKIEGIYHSRSTDSLCYLAIVAKNQFTIYYLSDNEGEGIDKQIFMHCHYGLNKDLISMGQINCIDFEQNCQTFVAGTNIGWIQIWDMNKKTILRRFRSIDPITKQPDVINFIKVNLQEKTIFSYNVTTMQLYMHVVEVLFPKDEEDDSQKSKLSSKLDFQKSKTMIKQQQGSSLKNVLQSPTKGSKLQTLRTQVPGIQKKQEKLEIDYVKVQTYPIFSRKSQESKANNDGCIQALKTDRGENHLFVIFQNLVQVYKISDPEKCHLINKFGPYETDQIFIDDFCTYMSVLSKDHKNICYYIFENDYTCERLKKPSMKQLQLPLKKRTCSFKNQSSASTSEQHKNDGRSKSNEQTLSPKVKILRGIKRLIFRNEE